MTIPARFPYVPSRSGIGSAGWLPLMPVELELEGVVLSELALLDSGGAISVLPYQMGLRLGGNWNQFSAGLPLGGVFSGHIAKPLFVQLRVGSFPSIEVAFAWTQAPHARLILGQINFFREFDVCFFGSKQEFHVQPRTP